MDRLSPQRAYYHFGDGLPTPREAHLRWVEYYLLQNESAGAAEVARWFKQSDALPIQLAVEDSEITAAFELGKVSGDLVPVGSDRVALSAERAEHLHQLQRTARDQEQATRDDWSAELATRFDFLTAGDLDTLWDGLLQFAAANVRALAARHEPRSPEHAQDLLNTRRPLPSLDPGHRLQAIAEVEYPAFLLSTDADRIDVLARLLGHAMYAFRTTVSDDLAQDATRAIKGRRLLLDTNVLISVVGLDGDPDYEGAVRKILELAHQLGFTLEYTEETELEYRHSLRGLASRIREGVDVGSRYILRRIRPSIDRAFFIERTQHYTTVDTFVARYQDLSALLARSLPSLVSKAYVPDSMRESLNRSGMVNRAAARLQTLQSENYGAKKLEHDAYNIGLAASWHTGQPGFNGSGGWFLTRHGSLMRVNDEFTEIDTGVVLTLDAWVLWFRPLLPRVPDFARFMAAMVSRHLFAGFYIDVRNRTLMRAISSDPQTSSGAELVETAFRYATSDELARVASVDDLSDDQFFSELELISERLQTRKDLGARAALQDATQQLAVEQRRAEALTAAMQNAEEEREKASRELRLRNQRRIERYSSRCMKLDQAIRETEDVKRTTLGRIQSVDVQRTVTRVVLGAVLVALAALVAWRMLPTLPQDVRDSVLLWITVLGVPVVAILPAAKYLSDLALLGKTRTLKAELDNQETRLERLRLLRTKLDTRAKALDGSLR